MKNEIARAALLTRGISLRGHYVAVLGQNPFLSPDGEETLRLSISNIPYATAIEPLLQALNSLGVKLTTNLMPEYFREENDKLINVKTGKLFAYMSPPKQPLPRFLKIMKKHKVYLSYLGQKEELERLEKLEKAREQLRDQEIDEHDQNNQHQQNVTHDQNGGEQVAQIDVDCFARESEQSKENTNGNSNDKHHTLVLPLFLVRSLLLLNCM